MIKSLLYNCLRWSLRLHGIFHIGHVYSDVVVGNWVGVIIGSYIILVELLSSFLIPNEHVHFRLMKTQVHEKCEDEN